MTYIQQSWVDGVTPITAATLAHIESGIGAVDAAVAGKADAGASSESVIISATGDGVTDVTATINSQLAAVPAGASVVFPAPTVAYMISDKLTVPRSMRIRGASAYVEIRQTAYPKPVFDCLDVSDVTITDFYFNYTGSTRSGQAGATFFRGDQLYLYAAGVWTNGSRVHIDNCRARRFTTGFYLSPWNSASGTLTAVNSYNRVTNVEVDTVDFGVLYLSQTDFKVRGMVAHDLLDSSGGTNPIHAVYGSGNTSLRSSRIQIADISCVNCTPGHAVQVKYVTSGTISNIVADTCYGLFNGIDLIDVGFSNMVGRGIPYNTSDSAFTVQEIGGSSFCTFSDITLHMTGSANGEAVALIGDDSRISDLTVHASRDGSFTNTWECEVRGQRVTVDGLRINGIGTGRSRALYVGFGRTTDGVIVRGLECNNTLALVDIDSTATNTQVIIDPTAQRNITAAPGSWVVAAGGTPTFTVATTGGVALGNAPTGTYTLVLSDLGKTVEMNVAGANALTIPPNSSVPFPVGATVDVVQYGAGQTTITAGAGVTLRTARTLTTRTQFSEVKLRQRAANEWVVSGDTT